MARFELPTPRYATVIYFTEVFNVLIEIYNFLLSLLLGMLVFVAFFIIPVGVVIAIIVTLFGGNNG